MSGISGSQTVRDQNGNPVWGIPARVGLRGSRPFDDPNTFHEQHVDRAGHVDVEYAARGFCAKTARDFNSTLFTVHFNFNEGFNPEWQKYASLSVDLDSGPSSESPIVLAKQGGVITPFPLTTISGPNGATGHGTVQEWKTIAHDIVAKNGLTIMEPNTGPQPQLQKFEDEMRKYDPTFMLQNSKYDPFNPRGEGSLKPRGFLPTSDRSTNADSGVYSRVVDFGSFGYPFFHDNEGHTDVWSPTGRPPSTQW